MIDPNDEQQRCRTCSMPLTADEIDSECNTTECTDCVIAGEMAFDSRSHGWCGRSDRHHEGYEPGHSEDQYNGSE